MILPNLFVPGAGKSATSSLHELLNQHPQIFMSDVKEPHFFSNDANFQSNHIAKEDKLEIYARLFAEGQNYLFRGESSTGYMVFPRVVERIQKNIPSSRFIFILRNPIDRAYSHYWWLRGRGYETRTFRDAVLADMHEVPNPENRVEHFGGYRYYFVFGQYATYLRPFITTFGKNNIFVMSTETLKNDIKKSMNQCFAFLGVEAFETISNVQANKTIVYKKPIIYKKISLFGTGSALAHFLKTQSPEQYYRQIVGARRMITNIIGRHMKKQKSYPDISPEDRQWLASLYMDEVQDLRTMTGLLFNEWAQDFPLD